MNKKHYCNNGYVTVHGKVQMCQECCPHDQGRWQLKEHYGENNGKWCCIAGCGHVVDQPDDEVTK